MPPPPKPRTRKATTLGGSAGKKAVVAEKLTAEEARDLVASLGKKFGWAARMKDAEKEEVVDEYLFSTLR